MSVTALKASPELRRPALRWHGGKWKLAPWILEHFPDHRVYVEPFGGAASVLLRKPRSYAEVYNDLDGELVNLFRVLRSPEHPALVRALRLTPYAREEYNLAQIREGDPVERARRLIVRSFMGHGSDAPVNPSGFRANSKRSGTSPAHDWVNYPDALEQIVERLTGVIIENRQALDIMLQHDAKTTLHYVDPPYLPETRKQERPHSYNHELTADDHTALLDALKQLQGCVVLSGYPHPIYDETLQDWSRVECRAYADGARPRTEVLWINREIKRKPVQLDLIGGEG